MAYFFKSWTLHIYSSREDWVVCALLLFLILHFRILWLYYPLYSISKNFLDSQLWFLFFFQVLQNLGKAEKTLDEKLDENAHKLERQQVLMYWYIKPSWHQMSNQTYKWKTISGLFYIIIHVAYTTMNYMYWYTVYCIKIVMCIWNKSRCRLHYFAKVHKFAFFGNR